MEVNGRDTIVCYWTETPVSGAAGASRQSNCHPANSRPPIDSPCSAQLRAHRLSVGSPHRGASGPKAGARAELEDVEVPRCGFPSRSAFPRSGGAPAAPLCRFVLGAPRCCFARVLWGPPLHSPSLTRRACLRYFLLPLPRWLLFFCPVRFGGGRGLPGRAELVAVFRVKLWLGMTDSEARKLVKRVQNFYHVYATTVKK